MSSTLIIRHLCGDLTTSEREHFLKYFGAQKVWFINPKSHTAFASFDSKDAAEVALYRLHQMEVLGKRLTVEYARDNKNASDNNVKHNQESVDSELKEFINKLNSSNPYLNICQPPPPNLSYKYPTATANTLFNILYALAENVQFYVQTLHLMNKMGLDPPFVDLCEDTKIFIKKCLSDVGIKSNNINNLSSQESEISSGEDFCMDVEIPVAKPLKRKSKLSKINKRIKLQQIVSTKQQQNRRIINTEEVFEDATVLKTKKIEINVNIAQECNKSQTDFVIGSIGKMNIPNVLEKETNDVHKNYKSESINYISKEDLLSNRISSEDMKILNVFKNYSPGTPSMRLYIKNLAKSVTTKDIEGIYQRYVEKDNDDEAKIFDVRVMQEGRMKGQGFVTLPNIEISKRALEETNGFIFKDKPMVVQFARTANK